MRLVRRFPNLLCMLMLSLVSSASWAERAMLTAELGTWLKQQALPELTRTLAQHPKFKGEPLRIAAVSSGATATRSNALVEAIRQQATHAVLSRGANDVATGADAGQCSRVNRPVYYLVGIEVTALGRNRHRVRLAVVDIEKAVWVRGISLTWEGRLLGSERAALATRVNQAKPGTAENPLSLRDTSALGENLIHQVKCRLPAGLDGPMATGDVDNGTLRLLLTDLHRRLALNAWAVSASADEAAWLLEADLRRVGAGLSLLDVSLRDADNRHRQKLASLYVDGRGAPPVQLLSRLTLDGHSDCGSSACAEVVFDLQDSAYLLMFRTHQARVSPHSCSPRLQQTSAGQHRYRIQLGEPGQRVGYYVIASTDDKHINALLETLQKAPGVCGNSRQQADKHWMKTLLTDVAERQHQLQWRAIHLNHTYRGATAL